MNGICPELTGAGPMTLSRLVEDPDEIGEILIETHGPVRRGETQDSG
jgi:hypothetical protein